MEKRNEQFNSKANSHVHSEPKDFLSQIVLQELKTYKLGNQSLLTAINILESEKKELSIKLQ